MNLQEAIAGLILNPIDDDLYKGIVECLVMLDPSEKRVIELKVIFDGLDSGAVSFFELDDKLSELSIYDYNDIEFIDIQKEKTSSSENLEDDIDPELLVTFLEEAETHIEVLASALEQIDYAKIQNLDFNILFRSAHTIKGSSASVGLRAFSKSIHNFEDFLSGQRDTFSIDIVQVPSIEAFARILSKAFNIIKSGDYDSVPYELLETITNYIKMGEPLNSDTVKEINGILSTITVGVPDYLKIPAERINGLFMQIERLQTLLLESEHTFKNVIKECDVPPRFRRKLEDVFSAEKLIVNQIQREVISYRLVPFRHIFPRINRVASEYTTLTGKKIDLVCEGGLVEIKKSVVDKLTDILLHMVKNSMDHGIEDMDERVKLNKSKIGKITVNAEINRSQIVVTVSDDGKGIDKTKVLNKAIETNLISVEESKSIDEQKILDFLFQPGFSTAEKVTSVSGRGVGMDAVKSMVGELGGTLKMESTVGRGSKTTLTFPSDVSVEEVVIIEAQNQNFAILLSTVESIISIDKDDLSSLNDFPYYETTTHLIPVMKLSHMIGSETNEQTCEGLLLIKEENRSVGILVEKIIRKDQIIATPPPAAFEKYTHISSLFTMDNGSLCSIIHPCSLVNDTVVYKEKSYVS